MKGATKALADTRVANAKEAEREAPKPSPLTRAEQMKLVDCEQNIAAGLETFVLVGASLATIREQRLYREDYPTFEAYVAGRWGFTDRRARQLIGASEVVQSLGETGTSGSGPVTERQARELAAVPAEKRVEVMTHAAEIAAEDPKAKKGRTETRHIRQAAKPHKPKPSTPPEPEGGEDHGTGRDIRSTPGDVATGESDGAATGDAGDNRAREGGSRVGNPAAAGSPVPPDSEAEPAEPSPVEPLSERDRSQGVAQGEVPSAGESAGSGSHSGVDVGYPQLLRASVYRALPTSRGARDEVAVLRTVVDRLGITWEHATAPHATLPHTRWAREIGEILATLLEAAGVERDGEVAA